MRRQILAVTALGFVVAIGSAACEKGPMQKAGEKIDRATDQDKAIGKGPSRRRARTSTTPPRISRSDARRRSACSSSGRAQATWPAARWAVRVSDLLERDKI